MVEKNRHAERTGCPVACALDIIGDHWSLIVVRDLMFAGRHEYKDMLAAEEGISSNILVDRLRKLEHHDIIASIPHPESGRRKLLYLTNKGKDLIHIMIEVCRWSNRHLEHAVRIPEDLQRLLVNDPEAMKAQTLATLAAWEEQYGISQEPTGIPATP